MILDRRPQKLEWSVTQAIQTLPFYIRPSKRCAMISELPSSSLNIPLSLSSCLVLLSSKIIVIITMDSYYVGYFDSDEPHFLESCSLCRKTLSLNSDVFMYRYTFSLTFDQNKDTNWYSKPNFGSVLCSVIYASIPINFKCYYLNKITYHLILIFCLVFGFDIVLNGFWFQIFTEGTWHFVAKSVGKNRLSLMKVKPRAGENPDHLSGNSPIRKIPSRARPYGQKH